MRLLAALALLAPFLAPAQDRVPVLDGSTFESLWDQVVPGPEEEAWREIPWRTTFWQGVIDAQEADRPVLLFAMNGHPFGCT